MTVDSLFIENIEEFVNDENKIVTYKWLSQTLNVNCNTAKQMLFKYIDYVRNDKNKDDISATYFISGLSKPDIDGVQAFKSAVIPEEKLTSYKESYTVVTSCHVYSVQKSPLKDSNALYMTDFEKFKEDVFNSNKYSSIQCERAELRSREEMEMLTMKMVPAADIEKKAAPSAVSKPAQKAMPKSAIANMFAKTENSKGGPAKETAKSAKTEPAKSAKTEPVKSAKTEPAKSAKTEPPKSAKTEPTKAEEKKAASKKSDAGMKSFFPKQTESSKPAPVAAKKDEKPKEVKKEIKKSPEKSPEKPASKKTARQEDSDDEPIFVSKRRKTDQDLFASDSGEEEEMEEEPECPLPPSPPAKEASPEPEKPIKESPKKQQTSKVDSRKTSGTGAKTRIRKRKQVNKTYMDKDGFMVTEKVWESESTDASESEEPVKKEVKKPAVKSPAKGGGKKGSPKKKPSPGKTNAAKQTSLTAFFKKS